MPFFSTEEIISGGRVYTLTASGTLRIAMAAVSGRMPAFGFTTDPCVSGDQINVQNTGLFQFESGTLYDFSGQLGKAVYVGRSGHVGAVSGGWLSGGFLSGDITQRCGNILNSGGFWFTANIPPQSGGPFGIPPLTPA